ncbi:flagellar hook-basal body protein [Peribacillus kribbensis]|uniref:flagellar hook-basal body protein n=1 Tax=Peribacillus kribbensis TaxID=356658 RepID=UPI000417715F|nr:flagellar hook-basal body protein [Peribacillus kribbensis]
MFKGFYTAASGMLSQQRRTEMLSNNISNANTPGYKADQSSLRSFPKMFLSSLGSNQVPVERKLSLPVNQYIGSLSAGVYMQEAAPDFSQGNVTVTDQNTDLALQDMNVPVSRDNGRKSATFFTVSNANGEVRYTRNGGFTLDAAGYLTSSSGNYVLDDQGKPIQLTSEDFKVEEDGTISENNRRIARLGIVLADNPFRLVKEGDGLFRAEQGQAIGSAYNRGDVQFKLQQGAVEQSNVDESKSMTDMMTAYRSFESDQKVLQAYDKSMDKAVNEVGRIG